MDGHRCKTLIVDEESLLRDLLAHYLQSNPSFEVIGQAAGSAEAMEACWHNVPDLVITEALPEIGGVKLIELVLQKLPSTRVLVLTALRDPGVLQRLRELKVHGFVEKDQSLEILEEALLEVASGRSYHTAAFRRQEEQVLDTPRATLRQLSRTEQEVLQLVAAGLTSKAIAQQLQLSPRSVESYRYRMMRKLGVERMAGLVKVALQVQFTTTESADSPNEEPQLA